MQVTVRATHHTAGVTGGLLLLAVLCQQMVLFCDHSELGDRTNSDLVTYHAPGYAPQRLCERAGRNLDKDIGMPNPWKTRRSWGWAAVILCLSGCAQTAVPPGYPAAPPGYPTPAYPATQPLFPSAQSGYPAIQPSVGQPSAGQPSAGPSQPYSGPAWSGTVGAVPAAPIQVPGLPGAVPMPAPAGPPFPNIERPNWRNPGTIQQQRSSAEVFDPYGTIYGAPVVDGLRPRDFLYPKPESEQNVLPAIRY